MQRYISVDAVMNTFTEEEKMYIYGLAGTAATTGTLPLKEGYQLEDLWDLMGFDEEQRIVANTIIENAAADYQIKNNLI